MRGALFPIGVCVVFLAACPADPRDKEKSQVVAKVGDREIREADLLAALAQRGVARIVDPAQRSTVAQVLLDEMIDEQLMLIAAEKAGITVRDDEVERELRSRAEGYPAGTFRRLLTAEQLTIEQLREKVRRRLVQDAFLRARLAAAPAITEAEVRARFDATLKDTMVPEQVRARQILVKTSEEASHILEQVRGRKLSFEQAAQKYSTAPDADIGGDLGWFSKGDMPDVFDICFNLEKGTISDVVASDYGFHIFQILDRRDARPHTFESARERIEEDLIRERQSEIVEQMLKTLRSETPLVVDNDLVARVVSLLPPPPVTPNEKPPDDATARALDSHSSAIDPMPPLKKPERPERTKKAERPRPEKPETP